MIDLPALCGPHARHGVGVAHIITNIVMENYPTMKMNIRQIFYRLVVLNLIPNATNEYKNLDQLLVRMRRDGTIPLDSIVDEGRDIHQLLTFDGVADRLDHAATYPKALWTNMPERVVIILEKQALAGVFREVVDDYDVPLVPLKGYSSLSLLNDTAQMIRSWGVPTICYEFGDYDPDGDAILNAAERDIVDFSGDPNLPVRFERIALTPEQAATLPEKAQDVKEGSSRAAAWIEEHGDRVVELDALPPDELQRLIREVIERHMTPRRLKKLRKLEEQERAEVAFIADEWRNDRR